jgi:hypothetical protein
MAGVGTRWTVGVLALGLWAGAPYAGGQQQSSNTSTHQRHHRAGKRPIGRTSTRAAGTAKANNSGQSSGAAAAASRAHGTPQSGYPTLENRQGTGNLNTLPNQTLTPGATTVPSNAGGIAPASNDASSGEYTPSEGNTAPTTPGGNPSETQGVPTFSSPAQPANADLPRTVNRQNQSNNQGAAPVHKARRTGRSSKAKPTNH